MGLEALMEHLTQRDNKALNDCIRKIYSDMGMQSLPNTIISAVSKVIPSNTAAIHAITPNKRKPVISEVAGNAEITALDAFNGHIHEHPIVSLLLSGKVKPHPFRDDIETRLLHKRLPPTGVTKISDMLTNSQFRSLALFNEFYRPNGIQYQLGMPLLLSKNLQTALALSRDKKDFSEKELLILNIIRPHIMQAYKNAEVIGRIRSDKTDIGSMLMDGKAKDLRPETMKAMGITLREAEILRWISQGKTNAEISIILNISLNTVKTHLQHIYEKLGVGNRTAATRVIMEKFEDV
ncbi:MAG: LuxR family transcriptional regulator [Nitrospirae bacterium]|nr:MAG: LuxR family transcriptional regulator [Nitrospirota bacterium]